MSNILFVTGTDTGVGKTVVSTLLLTGLRQRGVDVKVVKPIETGCRLDEAGELVAADAVELWKASGCVQTIDEVSPYRFLTAVAPNVAARKEDREINYSALCQHIEEQSASAELLIVEGAGGLLVGITEDKTFADLIKDLDASVLLVVASRLGCINHTALSLEVLTHREIDILGYLLNEGIETDVQSDAFVTNRVSVSQAASVYGVSELAKISRIEDTMPQLGIDEIAPLVKEVYSKFGLG